MTSVPQSLSVEKVVGSLGLDAYQRSAQLNPATLTILAPLVTIVFWLPDEAKLLTSLVSLAASAALIVLLMQIARARGRAIQSRLIKKHGELESTIGLRHRDTHIAGPTRQRYHAFLVSKGLAMPSPAEELADPAGADEHYRAAADWLREQTRDPTKFALLQGENRTYGFRRNLRGMKGIGLTLTSVSFLANCAAMLFYGGSTEHILAALLLGAFLFVGLLAWIFIVSDVFVEDASWAYTVRLLASCDLLPQAKRKK